MKKEKLNTSRSLCFLFIKCLFTADALAKIHLQRILNLLWNQYVSSTDLSTLTSQKPSFIDRGFGFYKLISFQSHPI